MSETLPRKLRSWTAAFEEYTQLAPSPSIYRKWCAISAVAGALERRVWVETNSGVLYPNMFIVLVGPPGTGKDPAIDPIRELWTAVGNLSLAPSSVSHKGLMDSLASDKAVKTFLDPATKRPKIYHSLLVVAPELGTILPGHDLGYLSMLNDLYQCKSIFEEKIRGREEILRIDGPHLHITAGTQPKYLHELLPETAFGMGFTARLIMVYHGAPTQTNLFDIPKDQAALKALLVHDLKQIASLVGEFSFTPEAVAAIATWHMKVSDVDKPRHSRLTQYVPKRIVHILKLCMVMSASRGNSLQITKEDFDKALALLLEAEAVMPEIFREMSSGGNLAELQETFNYTLAIWYRGGKKPIPEAKIVHFMTARVPTNQIKFTLDTMIRSGMLKVVGTGSDGYRHLEPISMDKTDEGQMPAAVHEIHRVTRKK